MNDLGSRHRGGAWAARAAAALLAATPLLVLVGALWSPSPPAFPVPGDARAVAATMPLSAAEGPAPAWNIVRLAQNNGGGASPHIAGDIVAWSGNDTVSVHDLASGDTRLLEAPLVTLDTVRPAGHLVVWVAGTGLDTMSVYAYEVGVDQAPVRISGAGDVALFAETDGRWVVWAEGDPGNIVLYDAVAKTTLRVTDDAVRDARPHVAGGLVVWEKGYEDTAEIYAYDIATERTWLLTDNARPTRAPSPTAPGSCGSPTTATTPRSTCTMCPRGRPSSSPTTTPWRRMRGCSGIESSSRGTACWTAG
ncbi:MAG: TolB-like translocation protein [Thermoleophilia bacterium]